MLGISLRSETNRNLIKNIFGSYLIKGLGVLCSLASMPLYLSYFDNQMILGVWFTMLSVLNWIFVFDLGIGNGLRNYLTKALSSGDSKSAKELISSAYIMLGMITILLAFLFNFLCSHVDWNRLFNISSQSLSKIVLTQCVSISIFGILLSFFLRLISSIIYALQKSAITNLTAFSSQFLVLVFLFIAPKGRPTSEFLLTLSYAYAISCNIPLIIATIWIFTTDGMRSLWPNHKFFTKSAASKVFSLGTVFLLLQILYMILSVTDSWFITQYYNPSSNVDYQIYYKPFSFIATLFTLGMTPLWSAITKALAEKRIVWILKLYKMLILIFCGVLIIQVILLFAMPWFFKVWLGKDAIEFNYEIGLIFVLYNTIFIWTSIQSTFASGLGKLNTQLICYLGAVLIKIGLLIFLHTHFHSWSFVVVATIISLIPYCILQPYYMKRHLIKLSR